MTAKKVFISYSHDSPEHSERVLALSERLRDDGITTQLDQYENGTPSKGWPRWMLDQLDEADSVIVVCTETYYRRFRGHEEPGKGKGADWEGAIITQEIYDARSDTVKFVPVLFHTQDEPFIPEPLRPLTYYLLNSEQNYNDLYDFLLGQAGVEPRAVGKPRIKERRRAEPMKFGVTTPASAGKTQIAPTRLHHGAAHLFGREDELAKLDQLAKDPSKKVLTIVAFGGVGKTSLVIEWMGRQAAKNWEGFERVFDWSFFSQGTREQGGASAEGFVAAALRFFGDERMAESAASPWDKGARLAQLIGQQRTLLVLDGVEPLQHPPGPLAGELKDPALATLLKGLARSNSGLCIVTTRERVADLAPLHNTTAPEWQLHHLSTLAGVELLKTLGVRGTESEFKRLVEDVRGHALTLNLLGRYLAKAHGGDIRKRDQVKFEKADAATQAGYAFTTIGAYEKWLNEGGTDGARQLAVLRLLGLFDRPAEAGCLAALRSEPSIADLTEPLVGLAEEDWNLTVSSLEECGLISRAGQLETRNAKLETALDAHPLIREYFAKQLKEKNSNGWRVAHGRIYEHLIETTNEGDEPTLEDLQPLYQAVAHGCQAGLQREALLKAYWDRIQHGSDHYAWFKLGAYGSELGAYAHFFETPWRRVSPAFKEDEQAWLLNEAAFCLRALGRLTESVEPMRAGLKMRIQQEVWKSAAIVAGNLSELELTLGEVALAIGDAEESVTYADRSGDLFQRLAARTTLADAVYSAGRGAEALESFREAEQMQKEREPFHPLLYSLPGFRYCELLLAAPERAAWQRNLGSSIGGQESDLVKELCTVAERAAQTLKWEEGMRGAPVLDFALHHLTLGRAALCAAILEGSTLEKARSTIEHALGGLRRAGQQDELPKALLTRAWLRFLAGAQTGPESAQEDLDEAWEIAERGPMRLHMVDIHLYRARLFHAVKPYPWSKFADGSEGREPKDDLKDARKLIEKCGYWRRKEELEDAEEAAKNWE
jgi:tetratricopeptide (TPR) repeat protein